MASRVKQLAHRAVAPVALVLKRGRPAGREPGERREDRASSVRTSSSSEASTRGSSACDVFLQRIDEDPEGQVALELRCRPGEHEMAAGIRSGIELCEEARLADAGLSHESNRRSLARIELGEELVERTELLGAPDEVLGKNRHVPPKTG